MMFKECLLFLALILLVGCEKPPVEPVNPCAPIQCDTTLKMGLLDTLWTKKITGSNAYAINRSLLLQDKNLIGTFVLPESSVIKSFDLSQKGKEQWVWNDVDQDYVSTFIWSEMNKVVNKSWNHRSTIDLSGGNTIQTVKSDQLSGPRGIVLGNHLYYDENKDTEREVWLLRSPITDLSQVDTLYHLNNDIITNSKKSIESYNLWIHPSSGDSILIFQRRMALPNRVDVVAWNMTKQQIEWKHDSLTKNGNSNHQQIFLLGDKAYFGGSLTFYCIDMFTGNILWDYDHPDQITGFMIHRQVYAEKENSLIVTGNGLFAFNPETGNLKWYNSKVSPGGGSPVYFNGIIYLTGAPELYAVKASNGAILWEERSRLHNNSQFDGEIAIDAERGLLYVSDRFYLMAVKLYKD